MYLKIQNGATTKQYTLTSEYTKPYMKISGKILPLTTKTTTGLQIKGRNPKTTSITYRAMEYNSTSESAQYLTSSVDQAEMSSTTALTRASTSATIPLTCPSTSTTIPLTCPSTSATIALTRSSVSATVPLTRPSVSATVPLTRPSVSATIPLTRSSTSGYSYPTRASTSATVPLTRSSTSGYSYQTANQVAGSYIKIVVNQNTPYGYYTGEAAGYSGPITINGGTMNFPSISVQGLGYYGYMYTRRADNYGTYTVYNGDGSNVSGWMATIGGTVTVRYNVVTTATIPLTCPSTSAYSYPTRASTSATVALTCSSTSAYSYPTRSSTSGYSYPTRSSTSGYNYPTRSSTSGYDYPTCSSTSGYTGYSSSSFSTEEWQ